MVVLCGQAASPIAVMNVGPPDACSYDLGATPPGKDDCAKPASTAGTSRPSQHINGLCRWRRRWLSQQPSCRLSSRQSLRSPRLRSSLLHTQKCRSLQSIPRR